ncbi:endonuclease/exonuclease/phosphatase family protein [Besnoitia besnoiti]|uniref:Endonuclease/exonuclease/phosphatase family protein n=1 Tax=Besnoitia besnoiti TaxID=94643 RepID=A0A2A9MF24_BESBE|nr:endonuclease/exonuclease/phosphatase family protein [Besnoitia besnoiti]PFH36489.1 endonuclease/exonuclease/phosphatase family protein [Besnoitia besnoiti]
MESGRRVLSDLLVTQNSADRKLLLTFVWQGSRINLDRSCDEPLERLLQRLRISCKKATQKKEKEGGKTAKTKASRKERKRDETSSPSGSTAAFGEGLSPEANTATKQAEDLPQLYLRRKDGTVASGDDACGAAFERGAFVCFSSSAPRPVSSDGAEERGEQNTLAEKKSRTGEPSRLEDGVEYALRVVWDPPVVRSIYVPQAVYTGCPVLVCLATEHASEDDMVIEWRYADSGPDGAVIHRGWHYTPTASDEGKIFAVTAYHPQYRAFAVTLVLPPVLVCPALAWHVERVRALRPPTREAASAPTVHSPAWPSSTSGGLRVCSFNILAGAYARTPHAVQAMYPYCSGHHLDLHHRRALLGKELRLLDADIVALQECSSSLYSSFFAPLFKEDYETFLHCKFNARVKEGCALLVRRNMFSVLKEGHIVFQKEFLENPRFDDLRAQLRHKWPRFESEVLPNLTTVMQYAVLKRREAAQGENPELPRTLIVANTHLFFHPYARHVRLLQLYVMSHVIKDLREAFAAEQLPSVVLCGDFNCQPGTGGIKLLKDGGVPAHLDDWLDGLSFRWEADEDAGAEEEEEQGDKKANGGAPEAGAKGTAKNVSDDHISPRAAPAAFSDAASAATSPAQAPEQEETTAGRKEETSAAENVANPGVALQLPGGLDLQDCYAAAPLAFSNFVCGFRATLDYIYASGDFEVAARLPGVSEEAVSAHGGLPCHAYPSDHLAIAVDLKLRAPPSENDKL